MHIIDIHKRCFKSSKITTYHIYSSYIYIYIFLEYYFQLPVRILFGLLVPSQLPLIIDCISVASNLINTSTCYLLRHQRISPTLCTRCCFALFDILYIIVFCGFVGSFSHILHVFSISPGAIVLPL